MAKRQSSGLALASSRPCARRARRRDDDRDAVRAGVVLRVEKSVSDAASRCAPARRLEAALAI